MIKRAFALLGLLALTAASAPPVFMVPSVFVSEAAGTAPITIYKSAKASSYSKVNVQTIDGTCHAGINYQAVNITLTFANSELKRTLAVTLIDNNTYGGECTFGIKLTSVRLAAVPSTATTVTVSDDELPPLPTGNPATAAYDTAIGAGVDADGFAALPLRAGAHRYFVRSSGSDANGCTAAQAPTAPLRTIAAGVGCITNGNGDQLLLAESSSFTEAIPFLTWKSGFSLTYPTTIESYDPTDALNEGKYGRADQRSARPVLTAMQGQVSNNVGPPSFVAIRGLDFNPGNVANAGMAFASMSDGLLIENNIFRYTAFSFDSTEASTTPPSLQHLIFRNNSSFGQWNPINGRTGGIYVAGVAGVAVEDNVFYHNGWKIGASRDDDFTIGGPTVFSHPIYLQTNSGAIVRRNLMMDAADTATARGNIAWDENVLIRNPSGVGLGNSPSYYPDRPNGVLLEAGYNLFFAAIDLNRANPRGLGFTTANGVPGSRVHDNLLIFNFGTGRQMFANYAGYDQPSYMAFEHNVGFQWNGPGETFYEQATISPGFGFPAQVHTTYDRNVWAEAPFGTNINVGSVTFPGPLTEAQLYATTGYAGYEALVADTIEHPEKHIQRQIRAAAFAGYGLLAN